MAREYLQSMNSALDQELSEQELAALNAQLEESKEASDIWEHLRQTDELLRTTPLVAPSPGFASRVMAAIAAMPLPGFMHREPGIGIALGLLVAALVTVPVFSVLFFMLLTVLADPGTLHTLLQTVLGATSYVIGLMADLAGEVEHMVSDTPVLAALLTTMIPVTLLWGWLIWSLLGGPRFLSKRPRS
jgi:hypothetical protein